MLRLFACFSLCFFIISPSYAAAPNAEDALRLKQSLQKLLDMEKKLESTMSLGNLDIIYNGELMVTPMDDYYAVETPDISIKGKDKDDKEKTVHFGKIAINAIPSDKPGEWKMMASLPSTMNLADGALEVSLGKQLVAGLYNEKLGYFPKLNVQISDLGFKSKGEDTGLTIGQFKIVSNLEQDEQGALSGPGTVTATDIKFKSPKDKRDFSVGELSINMSFDKLQYPTIDEMLTKLDKYQGEIDALKTSNTDPAEVAKAQTQKLTEMISDLYLYDMNGISASYAVKDVHLDNPDKDPTAVNLDSGHFGIDLAGMQSDDASFGLKIGFANLKVDAKNNDKAEAKLVPGDMDISIKATKIPAVAIKTLASNSLKGVAANPDMAQIAIMGAVMKLPMMLSQSGTTVEIEKSFLKGGAYNAILQGNVTADMQAVTNVTAKIQGFLEGLDGLIELAGDTDAPENAITNLTKLKEIGKQATSPNGNPAYSYEFVIAPDGTMTINGKNVMELSGK